ncbi:esterase-like activity of phytase family protein [Phenylobacterium sp. NIBR 498073]|uniref:esterase-like activity of phytase family protein n=1 Tax=Phenylobacterium sp. NIBR 498073 TaxID=3015177 RepID=UPI0022B470F3|nr:esterase-like activity of phytase family protein [Phenylobacterium sp. NIBR 498073]WGU39544.1 esterase-like activity of phytase family protein [Phenylobacterium sp. NIBR 498073]
MSIRLAAALASLALAACAQQAPALPTAPLAAGPAIAVAAALVPLNPADPAQDRIGDFRYAGGLALSSADTARFHGLSDMAIRNGVDLTAVSDEGDLLKARLMLDKTGRLVGLEGARISALPGLDGKPLQGKLESDSEGMALLANGDMLISFEQRHRIWLYPADGSPPREAPAPDASFPANGGMEALGPAPDLGPDVYLAGGEESGQTWTCRLSAGCTPGPVIAKPPEFGLVALTRLPQGRTAWLLRAWDPVRGNRVILTVQDAQGAEVGRLDLARPLTIDNFEAVAAVPAKDGAVRFYLLSDDNFQSSQRTLLLAFDWTPARS